MKIEKPIKPYKGMVTKKGGATMFSCQDSIKIGDGKWENGCWYTIYAAGLEHEIEPKNPKKEMVKVGNITGVTFQKYNNEWQVTIWAEDCSIVDADGNAVSGGSPIPGFENIDDDSIPF